LLFFVASLIGGSKSGPPLPFLIVPVFMLVIGFFFMKKLVFDLVDEVLDGGDVLVIRNGHLEERVALSDIMNVSYSQFTSPPRVTLLLRHPSVFGTRVAFCAPLRFLPFSTDPIIDELIVITHPYPPDGAAVRLGAGAARASRMTASAVRPARRPVATTEQRSA
jgi:hypothetical protein